MLGTADGECVCALRGGRRPVVAAARRLQQQPPRRAVCRPPRPRARRVGVLRAGVPRRALGGRHKQLRRERARRAAALTECTQLQLEPARPPSLTCFAFARTARSRNVSAGPLEAQRRRRARRHGGGARTVASSPQVLRMPWRTRSSA